MPGRLLPLPDASEVSDPSSAALMSTIGLRKLGEPALAGDFPALWLPPPWKVGYYRMGPHQCKPALRRNDSKQGLDA
jgi:hypothetical protein